MLCHGVLEVVDDPAAALRTIAAVLRPGGTLSLLVAQRHAAVVARAMAGHFAQARHALDDPDGRWGPGDPMPAGSTRPESPRCSARPGSGSAPHGVRVFADLVPSALSTSSPTAALLELEHAASRHPDYAFLGQLGAALHVLARRA